MVTLRDASSVAELDARLQKARRVVLIGNGGIALELAHALRSKHVRPGLHAVEWVSVLAQAMERYCACSRWTACSCMQQQGVWWAGARMVLH